MTDHAARCASRPLLLLVIVYGAASLLHFAHNAVFLGQYPNLPAWLTAGGVWAAWCGVTAVGALGYYVYRRVSRAAGLLTLGVYALLGFGGLDHSAVAPVSAHSVAMNTTIIVEVAAASTLLVFVGWSGLSFPRYTSLGRGASASATHESHTPQSEREK